MTNDKAGKGPMGPTDGAPARPRQGRPGPWDGAGILASFRSRESTNPWSLGYRSFEIDELDLSRLTIEGALPAGLRGTFYRNGPARHERGGQRYAHRWDGDGLVQAFRFDGSAVEHRARFVRTAKFVEESRAGRFLHDAFGTAVVGGEVTGEIDTMNSANISVCMAGDDLLALWEPGSAYRLDPTTLATRGFKVWHRKGGGKAFSAHPKLHPNGELWNFGTDPVASELTIYRVDARGELLESRTLHVDPLPPLHDFAVTRDHLVFLMPPLFVDPQRLDAGLPFGHACKWLPSRGMRVLVVGKADASMRWYELPAACVFHVANAWEDRDGMIHLDYMGAEHPLALLAGWSVMEGEYRHAQGAQLTRVELPLHGPARRAVETSFEGEFPVVDPGVVGERHRHVLLTARSRGREATTPGFDELLSIDVESGRTRSFRFGEAWMVEEHVLVAPAPGAPARWAIGTALDLARRRTVLSVFEAADIEAGPIARATLEHAFPLGLHGCFKAAAA